MVAMELLISRVTIHLCSNFYSNIAFTNKQNIINTRATDQYNVVPAPKEHFKRFKEVHKPADYLV